MGIFLEWMRPQYILAVVKAPPTHRTIKTKAFDVPQPHIRHKQLICPDAATVWCYQNCVQECCNRNFEFCVGIGNESDLWCSSNWLILDSLHLHTFLVPKKILVSFLF